MPPPNSVWNAVAKCLVDDREGFLEFLFADLIELRDGLLRIGDGLQQVVPLAAEEFEPLLAFIVFLERHHVDRAHGLDAGLHLVVLRVRDAKFLARKQGREFRDQILRLRVQFLDAGLPQVFAFGIVAGALDLVFAAFFAEIAEFLPRHAQGIVHLRRANARLLEFPLHFDAARFQALFLGAQRLHLPLVFRGLRRKLFLFLQQQILLRNERRAPRRQVLAALAPCVPRAIPRSPGVPPAWPSPRAAPPDLPVSPARSAAARLCCSMACAISCSAADAGVRNFAAPPLRGLRAPLAQLLHRSASAQVLSGRRSIPCRAAPCRLAPDRAAMSPRRPCFSDSTCCAVACSSVSPAARSSSSMWCSAACASEAARSSCNTSASSDRNSRFMPKGPASEGRPPLTTRPWYVVPSGVTNEYAGFSRARRSATAASATKKRRLQPRQKLLCRRAQRIAEFHETVEPRDGLLFDLEWHNRFIRLQIQFAKRVHEERGAPADFLAKNRDARARDIECLHHDVFQFVAQKLFDRALILLLDFGVIGQHADGAEPAGIIAALIGRKQFLHSVRGIGAIVQDLLDRGSARAAPGQRIAGAFRLRRDFVLFAAQLGDSFLRVLHDLFQAARALEDRMPLQIRGLRALAMVQRFLKQLLLLPLVARHAFDVMRQGLFGLRLLAVQTR